MCFQLLVYFSSVHIGEILSEKQMEIYVGIFF